MNEGFEENMEPVSGSEPAQEETYDEVLAELRQQTDLLNRTYELQNKAYIMLFITSGFVCYYIFRKIAKSMIYKMGGSNRVR